MKRQFICSPHQSSPVAEDGEDRECEHDADGEDDGDHGAGDADLVREDADDLRDEDAADGADAGEERETHGGAFDDRTGGRDGGRVDGAHAESEHRDDDGRHRRGVGVHEKHDRDEVDEGAHEDNLKLIDVLEELRGAHATGHHHDPGDGDHRGGERTRHNAGVLQVGDEPAVHGVLEADVHEHDEGDDQEASVREQRLKIRCTGRLALFNASGATAITTLCCVGSGSRRGACRDRCVAATCAVVACIGRGRLRLFEHPVVHGPVVQREERAGDAEDVHDDAPRKAEGEERGHDEGAREGTDGEGGVQDVQVLRRAVRRDVHREVIDDRDGALRDAEDEHQQVHEGDRRVDRQQQHDDRREAGDGDHDRAMREVALRERIDDGGAEIADREDADQAARDRVVQLFLLDEMRQDRAENRDDRTAQDVAEVEVVQHPPLEFLCNFHIHKPHFKNIAFRISLAHFREKAELQAGGCFQKNV